MPHVLLSSRRHVRKAGLVPSKLPRTYAKVEHRGGQENVETCIVKVFHQPHQIPISEGFLPVEDVCYLSGKFRGILWCQSPDVSRQPLAIW